GVNGREDAVEQEEPVPGWYDNGDAGGRSAGGRHLAVPAGTDSGRPGWIGHALERLETGVASQCHQGIAFLDRRVGRGVEDHLSAVPLYGDDDDIKARADSGVFQRT